PSGSGGSSGATPKPTAPKPAPGAPATPGPAPASPASGGSAVVLASVGTQSGPAASTLKPVTDGAQLWAKAVNAKRGLNGHQVKDKHKLATVTCAEASACHDADKLFANGAAKYGYQIVYRAQASIAQPDYTAECLAARNSGAEIAMVVLDGNSVSRFAASCAR